MPLIVSNDTIESNKAVTTLISFC